MTTKPWLHIVGIGEDGMAGLSADARAQIEQADVILGGDRHHHLAPGITAERLSWPSPFDAMIETIQQHKGRRFVILVTGDPLWYSVGARILRAIPAGEIVFHPQLSAFQWAAARLGWSLADTETVTAHGRPDEQILAFLAPGVHLLVLTKDRTSPKSIGALLTANGYGPSRMHVLAALGGPNEQRFVGTAEHWSNNVPDFHTLAIECIPADGASLLPRGPGLPDDAFEHDGKMTKRDIRAVTLAKLWPRRGNLLWDIGLGCGSVAIEWMRMARDTTAIGLEPIAERREIASRNALKLGAPRLEIRNGRAPDDLDSLPDPDAVFIGGGLSQTTIQACLKRLQPHGRLVANAVTLESEAILAAAHKEHGGELVRIAVAHAEPVGPYRGWRAQMPVTQWSLVR